MTRGHLARCLSRTTLALVPGPAGGEAWVAVHSHMSLAKGVPADSHAQRPIKAM